MTYGSYTRCRESEIEWLGNIPEHWAVTPLKVMTRFINGMAFKPEDWSADGVPIIRIENLNGGQDFNFFRGSVPSKYHVCDGDLLFGWSGNRGTSFGPFLWSGNGIHYLNQHIFKLTAFECNKSWLYWCLKAVTRTIEEEAHGIIGLVHVTRDKLGTIPIPTLPLDEQRAIAAFLDRKTARIDGLIAKKERQIELLNEKRAALISHAVTKGLDPNAPMKDSGVEWLGAVPAHWNPRKLGYLTRMISGSTPSKGNDRYWAGAIPWVSPKDMKRREIADTEDHVSGEAVRDTSLSLIEPPVVLIVVRGMILAHTFPVAVTSVPLTINQDMKALIPNSCNSTNYLAYLLEGISSLILSFVEESAHGTKCLRTDVWKNIAVFMPDESEQLAVCSAIEEQNIRLQGLSRKVHASIAKLREYRSALISAAVTGKISVYSEARDSKAEEVVF